MTKPTKQNELLELPPKMDDVGALIWLAKVGKRADGLARPLLWKVNQEEGYKEKGFETWDEFVESPEGLDRSRGWASQQITIHRVFTIEGGLDPDKVEQVGMNRLYKAARLADKTPEEKFAHALSWHISDFKAQAKDDCKGHEYEMFCKHCWQKKP